LEHPKNQDNRRVAKAAEGSQSRNDEAFFDQENRKAGKDPLHSCIPHSRNPKPKSSSISNLRLSLNLWDDLFD
jgi:hypothetical protein